MADRAVDPESRASGTAAVRGTLPRGLTRVGLVSISPEHTARDPETGRPIALPGGGPQPPDPSGASGTAAVRGTPPRGLTQVGLVGISPEQTARDPATGRPIALPGGGAQPRDPRLRGDYIDQHVTAVAYGLFEDFYLLWCAGRPTSMGVDRRLVDFRRGHWRPSSLDIHPTIESAFRVDESTDFLRWLPTSPPMSRSATSDAIAQANDAHTFYSFFPIRLGNNSYVCPTRFNYDSAPRTVDLVRGAIELKVAQVTADLTALQRSLVWQGAARLVFAVGSAIVQRLFATPPSDIRTLRSAVPARPAAPPAPRLPPAYVPRRLSAPGGEIVPIKSIRQTIYHAADDPPAKVFRTGLPGRGQNGNLWDHVTEKGDSSFRGGTLIPGEAGKRDSGVVYKISNVETWDVNAALGRIDKGVAGFSGNPMYGEQEFAFKAAVPASKIEGYFVKEGNRMGAFVPNPNFGK